MIALLTPFTPLPAEASATRPLLRVGDHPVIVRNLTWLVEHGIKEIAIDVRPAEAVGVEEVVGDGARFGLDSVHFVGSEHPGSASSLLAARPFAGEDPIVVVDSGRLFAFDLPALLTEHAESPAIATIAVEDCAFTGPLDGGAWRAEVDRSARVVRLAPPSLAPELGVVAAGGAVVESRLVAHVPTDRPFDLQRDLFAMVIHQGGVLGAHRIHGRSYGLDTPAARDAAVLAFVS